MDADDQLSRQLHLTFVEMLFALAIGEVAIDASSLVSLGIQGCVNFRDSLPAYSHLLLATIVIAASWVGWRNSKVSGTKIKSVLSLDFLELLVDVFLVICYFLLVRLAELPTGSPTAVIPNASRETWMILVIMGTYVFWDFLSCRTDRRKFRLRLWASAVCFVLSLIALALLPLRSDNKAAVILADASLLAIVFVFRAMKLHDRRDHTTNSKCLIIILILVFVAFALLARRIA